MPIDRRLTQPSTERTAFALIAVSWCNGRLTRLIKGLYILHPAVVILADLWKVKYNQIRIAKPSVCTVL